MTTSTNLKKYRSPDFCEGEKLPRSSQLSISITPKQKTALLAHAREKKKSASRIVRGILKAEGII
jgi:hypothetical protein